MRAGAFGAAFGTTFGAALLVALSFAQAVLAEGWGLRRPAAGGIVALADGPGGVRSLAAFCLEGRPFLGVVLDPAGTRDVIRLTFAFSHGTVSTTARREAGTTQPHMLSLADRRLAEALSGRDSTVALTVEGAPQGTVSLRGSSRALRTALADCLPL